MRHAMLGFLELLTLFKRYYGHSSLGVIRHWASLGVIDRH